MTRLDGQILEASDQDSTDHDHGLEISDFSRPEYHKNTFRQRNPGGSGVLTRPEVIKLFSAAQLS